MDSLHIASHASGPLRPTGYVSSPTGPLHSANTRAARPGGQHAIDSHGVATVRHWPRAAYASATGGHLNSINLRALDRALHHVVYRQQRLCPHHIVQPGTRPGCAVNSVQQSRSGIFLKSRGCRRSSLIGDLILVHADERPENFESAHPSDRREVFQFCDATCPTTSPVTSARAFHFARELPAIRSISLR